MALFLAAVEQGLIWGLAALGVYLSFRVLNFPDLSVDGTFPLGAAVTATLISRGWDPFGALALAAAAGMAGGLWTAALSTRFRIQGLLAGVLTMIMLYSLNLRVMGRPNLPLLGRPSAFRTLSILTGVPGDWAKVLGAGLLGLGCAALLIALFRTELGLALRASGDNPTTAQAYGLSPAAQLTWGLALSNGLVALSGGLAAQYLGFADIGMGIGTIVSSLAAVIIGEILFRPRGVGWGLLAALGGSVVYQGAIRVALRYGSRLGFTASDMRLLTALVVLAALVAPAWRLRKEG